MENLLKEKLPVNDAKSKYGEIKLDSWDKTEVGPLCWL